MWKLQMPVAKRIGLIAMLSLGLLYVYTSNTFTTDRLTSPSVTSISVVRIVSVTKIGADDTCELLLQSHRSILTLRTNRETTTCRRTRRSPDLVHSRTLRSDHLLLHPVSSPSRQEDPRTQQCVGTFDLERQLQNILWQ